MSKTSILLTSVLSLGFAAALQAHPLDSPDIVYFDGVPCNSACRDYLVWSRQTLSMSGQATPRKLVKHSTDAVAQRRTGAGIETSNPPALARVAEQAVPIPGEMPRTAITAARSAGKSAPNSDTPTTQEEVAAALAASAVRIPEHTSNTTDASAHFTTVQSSAAGKSAPVSQNADDQVALVMARLEINSVSDLANKDIAIDDKMSASSAGVRAAIAAAGAAKAQLIERHTEAIDRLVGGEVAAAVLALVSPQAAEWFPEIEGFKIFRIPLLPKTPL